MFSFGRSVKPITIDGWAAGEFMFRRQPLTGQAALRAPHIVQSVPQCDVSSIVIVTHSASPLPCNRVKEVRGGQGRAQDRLPKVPSVHSKKRKRVVDTSIDAMQE